MARQEKKKPITIYDIASKANTSVATVSRVLSNSDYPVSEKMREKIKKTAAELNYTPNLLGRMFKKNEVSDIGVIVPTIQNPFYTQVLIGVENEVKKSGYDVLLYNSYRDVKAERRHIEKLSQKQIRGLIISSVDAKSPALMAFVKTGGTVVMIDQNIEYPGCINVKFDFVRASRMAVDFLVSMGHRNIAFLSSPQVIQSRVDNLTGYRLTLAEHAIPVRPENVIISESEYEAAYGMYEFENGKELAKKFCSLKPRPTAIFTVNDLTAFGIIQELTTQGICVPDEVSVMGFDNIEISKMSNPSLTTVSQPSYETGRIASVLLLGSLNGNAPGGNVVVELEASVVVRNSVKRIAQV